MSVNEVGEVIPRQTKDGFEMLQKQFQGEFGLQFHAYISDIRLAVRLEGSSGGRIALL